MSLTLTLPLQFESPQIPHDEEQTFGVVHVDPAPCQMPPAVPQLDCVKLRQPPEVKQHAPWGSGQLVDPQLVLLPWNVPPCDWQLAGETGPVQEPVGRQQAPCGKQTKVAQAVPLPP